MVSLVKFFVLVATIATAYGQVLNVTNSTQDYVLLTQRELNHNIEITELEIAAVNARYADRLETVQYQQQQTLQEINQVNQTLLPMQALSVVRKHCIQKFDSQLVTYEKAKAQFKVCYDSAASFSYSLTSNAQSFVNNAKTYVNYQLPNNVANCDKVHSKNQTALEICYVDYVDTAKTSVGVYLENADKQLDLSLYNSFAYSREAVRCSYKIEKNILETIGETTKAIDLCEVSTKRSAIVEQSSQDNAGYNLIMGKILKR